MVDIFPRDGLLFLESECEFNSQTRDTRRPRRETDSPRSAIARSDEKWAAKRAKTVQGTRVVQTDYRTSVKPVFTTRNVH